MQADQRLSPASNQGRTKYVFAASRDEEDKGATKVCPRCGEVLFADMDVCYGCLYDFGRERSERMGSISALRRGNVSDSAQAQMGVDDPLATIDLDEIDDDDPPVARHRREKVEEGDTTLDLGALLAQDATSDAPAVPEKDFLVQVTTPDLQVCLPLPPAGLTVGRDVANDIVLKSRAVSRTHLRITPSQGYVLAEDCGATNPATKDGEPLTGTARLHAGETLLVCGTCLKVLVSETTARP